MATRSAMNQRIGVRKTRSVLILLGQLDSVPRDAGQLDAC